MHTIQTVSRFTFLFMGMLLVVLMLTFCGQEGETLRSEGDTENIMSDTQWNVDTLTYGDNRVIILSGFIGPYGITPTEDGNLYVADLKEGRVIRFNSSLLPTGWLGVQADDLNNISGWHTDGSPVRGSSLGMFDMCHSIAFGRNGRIYISDYANGRVHIYDTDGTFRGYLFDPPRTPEVAFQGTPNAEFDTNYNLWVSDFDAHRIYKFAEDMSFLGWMGGKPDGTVTDSFVLEGSSDQSGDLGGFNKPHMVQVDDSGYIYVVETGNNRIQKFSPDGHALGWIGGKLDGTVTNGWEVGNSSIASNLPGGFNAPVSLRLIDNTYFLIADNGNHRIQKFSLDGHFLGWLGGKVNNRSTEGWATDGVSVEGSAPGFFSAPFDARYIRGKLFVADGHNGRIQIFEIPI